MRLEIDGGGYDTAAQAFVNANQLSALCFDRLTGNLAGCGGMAGDDSTSAEFAAAYDESAREAVAALADLVDSFTNLGHLTQASLANHVRANVRSIVGGATLYDGGLLPDVGDDVGYVVVLRTTPPSSLGSNSASLPSGVNWILDLIEGFVWPNADTNQLRVAEQTWRAAAAGLDDLTTCCECAIRGFWGERSPEIPLAIEATHELMTTIRGLAEQYDALAAACETYADQVEAKRGELIDLAVWLLEQIVEGILISAALGILTAGAGAAAGTAAVLARVAAESPKFLRILQALRTLTASTAASVRLTHEALKASRLTLTKFRDARMAARSSEAGELNLWGRSAGWLRSQERSGSHTLEKHVGKTDEQLLQRLRDEPWLKRSSSFTDERTAESAISRVLAHERSTVLHWLQGGKRPLELDGVAPTTIGRCTDAAGGVADAQSLRVVLVRDRFTPDGYRILTAFPKP